MIAGLIGLAAGYVAGFGWWGIAIAVVIAGATAFISYWKADSIALAVSRAQPADPQQYRRLYNLVEGLCIASGLPQPRIYVVDDPAPNAFATGRNPQHAAIAVTTGLLEKLNRVELEGVIAHELSHIKNYDILVSTLAVTLVGAVALDHRHGDSNDVVERRAQPARGRPRRQRQPAGDPRLRPADRRSDRRQGDAGGDLPTAGDAGRHLRVSADALSAGPDLGAREASRRRDGHALGDHGNGPSVDRTADGGRRRPRPSRVSAPTV